jgi:UDP-N-acetylmuramate dehydrogenase
MCAMWEGTWWAVSMTMRMVSPFAGLEEFVKENEPLARFTWFGLGGPARWMVRPRNEDELRQAAERCLEGGVPIYVLGLGANVLIRDAGIDGAVFRLDSDYWRETRYEDGQVYARSGMDMQKLVVKSVRQGMSGIECLAGIPGTIGGGIRMNAGGRFGDIGGAVKKVTVMDRQGQIIERWRDDLHFEYRNSNLCAPFILDATLELQEEDPQEVLRRTREIWMYKRNSQPLNARSAGCVFKNPPDSAPSAGALIDRAGLKGTRLGGAEVSTKHANFIVANAGCTAEDVLKLIEMVKEKVYENSGVELENEVQVWP